jgi:hypothetical protein
MWRFVIKAALSLCVVLFLAACWAHQPRPKLEDGVKADALARRVMSAVGADAWRQLHRMVFTFRGQRYDWKMSHQSVQVGLDSEQVILDLRAQTCARKADGEAIEADECRAHFSRWNNDSFWLHPFGKFFDPGAERSVCDIEEDGRTEPWLCVRFGAGGSTPGDLYAIQVGADGRPSAWRMWVKILPVGGVYTRWSNWKELPGGAWFAGLRELGVYTIPLELISIETTARSGVLSIKSE